MKSESKPIKIDRRLTGSSIIDEPLQQVRQQNQTNRWARQLKVRVHAFEEPVVSLLMSLSQTVELSLHKLVCFCLWHVRCWISLFESLGWTACCFLTTDEHMTLVFSQWSHMLYWIGFKFAYNAYILLGSFFFFKCYKATFIVSLIGFLHHKTTILMLQTILHPLFDI